MKVSDLTEPVQRQLHAIVVLVSWHEIVEDQDSCTCKLLKPFTGIKHVKITGYKTKSIDSNNDHNYVIYTLEYI
jgi:hypothetical protein